MSDPLASNLGGSKNIRQLPGIPAGIKETAIKTCIRHLTRGEPDGRQKALKSTAVVIRYISDLLGISHVNVPTKTGAKTILLDAIDLKVCFYFFFREGFLIHYFID